MLRFLLRSLKKIYPPNNHANNPTDQPHHQPYPKTTSRVRLFCFHKHDINTTNTTQTRHKYNYYSSVSCFLCKTKEKNKNCYAGVPSPARLAFCNAAIILHFAILTMQNLHPYLHVSEKMRIILRRYSGDGACHTQYFMLPMRPVVAHGITEFIYPGNISRREAF